MGKRLGRMAKRKIEFMDGSMKPPAYPRHAEIDRALLIGEGRLAPPRTEPWQRLTRQVGFPLTFLLTCLLCSHRMPLPVLGPASKRQTPRRYWWFEGLSAHHGSAKPSRCTWYLQHACDLGTGQVFCTEDDAQ